MSTSSEPRLDSRAPGAVSLPEAGGYPLKRRPCSRRGWESERRRADALKYLGQMDALRPDLVDVTGPWRHVLATRRYITEEAMLRMLVVVGRAVRHRPRPVTQLLGERPEPADHL